MASVAGKIETVEQFVGLLQEIKIFGAKGWLETFSKGVPQPHWEAYLKTPLTEEVVATIGGEISQQITAQLCDISRKGHAFMREIHKAAISAGLEIESSQIDRIREPLPPPPSKAKKP